NTRYLLVPGDEGGLEWKWRRVEARDKVEAANVCLDLVAVNNIPALLNIIRPEHARHIDHH
ncbi:MAG: hypothetical protein Q9181_005656, partial [Wetmoreana brouardii]